MSRPMPRNPEGAVVGFAKWPKWRVFKHDHSWHAWGPTKWDDAVNRYDAHFASFEEAIAHALDRAAARADPRKDNPR